MRTMELVVGLVAGCAIGFALHEWFAPEAAPAPGSALRPVTASAPERAKMPRPVPTSAPAVPLPLDSSPVPPALATSPGSAAADALVGILVHGAVLDTAGQPVAAGERWLSFDDGRTKPLSVKLAPTSTYSVSGLRPGTLTVSLDHVGYRPYRAELVLAPERSVVRHDILLEPAVTLLIKGFTPSGEPLVDAVVRELGGKNSWSAPRLSAVATREPFAGNLPEISHRAYDRWGIGTYSDRLDGSWNGTSDLPLDVMGRLELDESLPAFVSLVMRHVLLGTQRVEPGAREVVFTVPIDSLSALLGTVSVRVLSAETSQPPEGATASLTNSQSSGVRIAVGPNGVCTWTGQWPGQLELSVAAPGYETWDQVVSVPQGGTVDLGTIELTPATSLSGLVVDGEGQPVVVSLRALRDDSGVGLGMGERRSVQSDVEGRFQVSGLGRHRYRIVVSSEEWGALPVFVDARNGDVSDVHVVVETGGTLRLRPQWPAGASYGLRVARADGTLISSSERWPGEWPWTKRLPCGAYTVSLLRDGQELKRVPLTLAAEGQVVDVGP